MPVLVTSLLSLIQYAPAAITEIKAVYDAIKGDMSATDQQTIDSALAAAQQSDAAATQRADAALDAAAKV